ncbi:MAG: hypothetical protein AAB400_00815 [Patescibacteria group bacterium]
MDQRKIDLLMRIIDSYILSGEPVGSVSLMQRYHLPYSSATIRNEMALLEELGHLFQPHISAGRIPTERGYQLYIQHLKPVRLPHHAEQSLMRTWQSDEDDGSERLKMLCRTISELSGEISFGALDGCHTYAAGLSRLYDKPESNDKIVAAALADIVEKIDDIIEDIFPRIGYEPEVWVGKQNALAPQCGAILAKCRYRRSQGIIGIVGPMRMQYGRNKAIITSAQQVLQDS